MAVKAVKQDCGIHTASKQYHRENQVVTSAALQKYVFTFRIQVQSNLKTSFLVFSHWEAGRILLNSKLVRMRYHAVDRPGHSSLTESEVSSVADALTKNPRRIS